MACSIIIDGFTNPCPNGDRFCLGLIANVNRTPTIENARKQILKGMVLTLLLFEYLLQENEIKQTKNLAGMNGMYGTRIFDSFAILHSASRAILLAPSH